ncbi:putative retrotransposon hot spot protein 4 (RHS4) [Trypanosoma vivax]|nr:putative retrotransposon hot spot protein 4 (RHS4) [Trypanosoma vivax]
MLSECLERVGRRGRDIDGDERMDSEVQKPRQFIPDADLREMKLSLPECRTLAFFCKVVLLVSVNGIVTVRRWGVAEEDTDAERSVRDVLADNGVWNVTSGLLDATLNAVKNAEARRSSQYR